MISALLALAMPLVLSEVLANEPGSVVSLEWIELAAGAPVNAGDYLLEANGVAIELPDLTLDSGQYLVVCRDTARFEAHYGDSSGLWGDVADESYLVWRADFSLANSSGELHLSGAGGSDRFTWSSSAPDGVSFERISDTLWGVTASPPGATPGGHNHGAPVALDWAIETISLEPDLPRVGAAFTLTLEIENRGTAFSTTYVRLTENHEPAFAEYLLEGEPLRRILVQVERTARAGLNLYSVSLDPDERTANDSATAGFYGAPETLRLSEIFAAPAGAEPEWLEFYVAADSAVSPAHFYFTSGALPVPITIDSSVAAPHSYLVATADSAAFRRKYGEPGVPVMEVPSWPTLNNSGDTLSLIQDGYLADRVIYPSFGSHRGVSFERIGDGDVWGLSVAPAGATPGGPNSIDVPYSERIELEIRPNPFAPPLGEQATIMFTVPFGAAGEVRLFAGDGRHLRTLYPRAPIVSGSLSWDGRDATGRLCPVGVYLVQLRIAEPFEQSRLATVVIAR